MTLAPRWDGGGLWAEHEEGPPLVWACWWDPGRGPWLLSWPPTFPQRGTPASAERGLLSWLRAGFQFNPSLPKPVAHPTLPLSFQLSQQIS